MVATTADAEGKLLVAKRQVHGTQEELDGLAELVQKGRTSNHTGRSADMQSYVDSIEERYNSKGSDSQPSRSMHASQSPMVRPEATQLKN